MWYQLCGQVNDIMRFLKQVIVAFLISSVLAVFMMRITKPMGFGQSDVYEAVTREPWKVVHVPESYRFVVPWMAHEISVVSHMNLHRTYFCIQVFCYAVILSTIWIWLTCGLRMDSLVAACICSLFVFSFPGVYNLHNLIHIGFVEHLLILLAFLLIYYNKYITLLLLLVSSCFVKESVGLVAIPTYFVTALTPVSYTHLTLPTILRV